MYVKTGKEILSSVLKTSQINQDGIRSALESAMCPGLRKVLEAQLQEYDRIETQALYLASQRGWELSEAAPVSRYWSGLICGTGRNRKDLDSHIAGMMIQRNTRDMVRGMKDQRKLNKEDLQIHTLTQSLLDCEKAYIRQMQCFL